MPKPKKKAGRRHSGQVLVRLLETDYRAVVERANAQDVSASQWVRTVVRKALYGDGERTS